MSLDRRGFLSLLGFGGAGLLLDKALPGPVTALLEKPLIMPSGSVLLTPAWVMKEVAVAFRDSLGPYELKYAPHETGARVGERLGGRLIDTQLSVDASWIPAEKGHSIVNGDDLDAYRKRYIQPLGNQRACEVKRKQVRFVTDLPMDAFAAQVTRVSSKNDGFSLRGSRFYDLSTHGERFRVDLLGAHA